MLNLIIYQTSPFVKEMILLNVNRKVGNGFEKDLCRSLSAYGFWVHLMTQNSQGQPFDVIAARNGVSYPIDCKDCANNVFKLDRIEENQFSAMSLWKETGNGNGWFALRLTNGAIYMITLLDMLSAALTKSVLSEQEIRRMGYSLKEWVFTCK